MPVYLDTEDGCVLEGALTVVSHEQIALIQVGDEYLDECLWRRFQPASRDLRPMSPRLRVERVRITIERVRDE